GVVTALWIIMGDNLTWFLIPVLLIAGLILTSRLILNIHKPGQVYSGFLLGFTVVAAVMLFLH
ncbi:MAG: hypothetical protein ACUVTX_09165, partial [Bacteroidales bacterium]